MSDTVIEIHIILPDSTDSLFIYFLELPGRLLEQFQTVGYKPNITPTTTSLSCLSQYQINKNPRNMGEATRYSCCSTIVHADIENYFSIVLGEVQCYRGRCISGSNSRGCANRERAGGRGNGIGQCRCGQAV